LHVKSTASSIYCSFFSLIFNSREMDHHQRPPDSGQKSTGMAASAVLGVTAGWKGKVKAAGHGSN
jgi:hypothetical protein